MRVRSSFWIVMACFLCLTSSNVAVADAAHAAKTQFIHTTVWKSRQFCAKNPNGTRHVQLTGYFAFDTQLEPPPAGMDIGKLYSHSPDLKTQTTDGMAAILEAIAYVTQSSIYDGEHVRVHARLDCPQVAIWVSKFWPVT